MNDNENRVHVFRFFQGERPDSYCFYGHENKVVSINWLDDDTGFITIGRDSKIAYWRLSDTKPQSEDGTHSSKILSPVRSQDGNDQDEGRGKKGRQNAFRSQPHWTYRHQLTQFFHTQVFKEDDATNQNKG